MKKLAIAALALVILGGALVYVSGNRRPMSEAALRRSILVSPDLPLRYRSTDCREVSFLEFSTELADTGGFVDKFMAPTEDSATLSIGIEGNPQCPLPYPPVVSLPPIDALDLDGRRVTSADLQGRPAMVSFFWENCVACIREVEHLNELQRRHPGVRMIALTYEPAPVADEFRKRHGLELQVLADQQQFINRAMVRAYPSQHFYDGKGKLIGIHRGWPTKEDGQAAARAEIDLWMARMIAAAQSDGVS